MSLKSAPLHCPCQGKYFTNVFTYTAPPEGEIRFEFSSGSAYQRELLRCDLCGHFVSTHDMDTGALYAGDYVNANYQDEAGIRRAFERIIALAPSRSDNVGRVRRILEFAAAHFQSADELHHPRSLLDVGSGLGVFPYRMKEAGWDCTALDPDIRAIRHAQEVVGVKAVHADFMAVSDLGRFDVITFNKVLEHVEDPVAMLAKSAEHLEDGSFVYVELPDGEAAWVDGPGREEFFIDHLHVFSMASLALLVARAGFNLVRIERVREPSSKYTLRAFAIPDSKSTEFSQHHHDRKHR
jgi:2-polyprenyl-3-methyl-5-hydroxy-6-metoxy-1,4-benzoquinol methylase